METLTFSSAQEQDIPVVAEILTEATLYKLKLDDKVWGDEGWSEDEVRDAMAESDVYLIRQGEEIVATVSLQWEDTRNWGEQPPIAGYMHRLAVKDGHHDQGLGEKIVDWVDRQISANGRQLFRLDCEALNIKLCRYYEDLSFERVGTREVPEYGDYVAALYERPVNHQK